MFQIIKLVKRQMPQKAKYPDAGVRGVKDAAMLASVYLALAAFAKWTRERVRLAHCLRE